MILGRRRSTRSICRWFDGSGPLTFAPGQTSKSFDITVQNDSLGEADETIGLALSDPNGAVVGTPSSATLTIEDDEPAGAPGWLLCLPSVRR
jgi:hypothetical protein